ncbi:hypothetical protein PMZ80_007098 [Knufia obscura]|uniref:Uncharacterized protein n=2 Tax=Knufia TaxID=430999 RepID=A0AAN8IME8_9EURO|nr:hypothetical protein PMZ80_007098 [Knufia obscura]KAK5953107.1 hypothetical protein OHC33_005675 [Knufia fluminis]
MGPGDWIPTSGKFQHEGGGLEWDDLENTAFDRIITSVHDFCLFMRDLFVPDDAILVPPESGWEAISATSFAKLNKSDTVIETLRHMTFIKRHALGGGYQILPDSGLCDWRDANVLKTITEGDPEDIRSTTETLEPAPPDVVGLCEGGRTRGVFERIKTKFRNMEQLPHNDHEVKSAEEDSDKDMDILREVYSRHGWPEDYKKADCLAEVEEKKIF